MLRFFVLHGRLFRTQRLALAAVALLASLSVAPAARAQHDQHTHDAHTGHSAAPQASPTPAPSPSQVAPAKSQPATVAPTPAPTPKWGDTMKPAAAPDAHAGHEMKAGETKTTGAASSQHTGHAMTGDADGLMVMSGEEMSLRVGGSSTNVMPMGQMGSGTAWQPASTPMHMLHRRAGEWLLMFHGEVKMGVNHQGGLRGRTTFESQNWFMPMAYRRVGRGTLQLRGMFSLEPLTFPRPGSPQLFQTGEVYKNQPIIDAQHPHDLFMELSAQYTLPLGERATWYTYFGYPGEPALGPVAFMHRASASENPTAPLSHHLQDSTHITFGVLTTGFTYRWLKLEGSIFNGREPGENRYDFEAGTWNSRAARLSIAPNRNWAFQISHGFLRNPEVLEPGDVRRTTASVQYNRSFARGNWATSLIWGRNHQTHDRERFNLNSYTAESTVNFQDKNYLYTRLELVDKNELLRHEDLHSLGFAEDFHPVFRIGAYTFGAARDLWNTEMLSVALGGDVTLYSKPDVLDTLYGRNPTSYKIFLRLRPARMKMSAGAHGEHGDRDE